MDIFFSSLLVVFLMLHTYTDLKSMLLYDSVTVLLALIGIIRAVYLTQIMPALQGAAVLFAIMLALYFASRGGMGEGDVKLAPALGVWLTPGPGLLALLLAFVSGSIAGGVLLLCGKNRRSAIPFGPFLCLGAAVAHFWGKEIIALYWQLMLP